MWGGKNSLPYLFGGIMVVTDILINSIKDFMPTEQNVKDQFDNMSIEVVLSRNEALNIINLAQSILLWEASNGKL